MAEELPALLERLYRSESGRIRATLIRLLGEGEALFAGLNLAALGYAPVRTVPGENATPLFLQRK